MNAVDVNATLMAAVAPLKNMSIMNVDAVIENGIGMSPAKNGAMRGRARPAPVKSKPTRTLVTLSKKLPSMAPVGPVDPV